MKTLVTGGAGFIGSHVVDALVDLGHEVVIADDLSTGKRCHVNPAARFYHVDVRDSAAMEEVFATERPEVVNHQAARVGVRVSLAQPAEFALVNVVGTINLLELAVRHGVRRFIFASTAGAVYGEPTRLPADEDDPTRPLCLYGASKLAAEAYVQTYQRLHDQKFVILRYPNVYGPRQDPCGECGVVAEVAALMLRGLPVGMNGAGRQTRDFLYVTDCAHANVLAMERGDNQVLNLGTGQETAIGDIFARLKTLTGYQGVPATRPARRGEVGNISISNRRAEVQLGWRPTVGLDVGLMETIRTLRETPRPHGTPCDGEHD